jgi:hypothetical protein
MRRYRRLLMLIAVGAGLCLGMAMPCHLWKVPLNPAWGCRSWTGRLLPEGQGGVVRDAPRGEHGTAWQAVAATTAFLEQRDLSCTAAVVHNIALTGGLLTVGLLLGLGFNWSLAQLQGPGEGRREAKEAVMISRLVSGGQTGVDRAALDVAQELGIPRGGWCPKGRKAEDGTISERYPLLETPSGGYSQRTGWNVRDSDGTLILTWGQPAGGTLLTVKACRSMGKPHLVIDLADQEGRTAAIASAREWLAAKLPGGVLNVAGPRASKQPHVYDRARALLLALLGRVEG